MFKYKYRIRALLNDNAEALKLFNTETENIENDVSNKCAYAFLVGALVSALIIGGSLSYFGRDKGMFLSDLKRGVNGNF